MLGTPAIGKQRDRISTTCRRSGSIHQADGVSSPRIGITSNMSAAVLVRRGRQKRAVAERALTDRIHRTPNNEQPAARYGCHRQERLPCSLGRARNGGFPPFVKDVNLYWY